MTGSRTGPPVCDVCKTEPATIQVMEQRGNQSRRLALCVNCAKARGAAIGVSPDGNSITLNLPNIIAAMTGAVGAENISCPDCGTSAEEFRQSGRLGCPRCYEVFDAAVRQVVQRVQFGPSHRGLGPQKIAAATGEADVLKRKLLEAVESERYEEAARLRDRIREMEKEGGGS